MRVRITPRFRNCPFCETGTTPNFKEVEELKRFISDRGKLLSHMRTGVCTKHQRKLTKAIKYARHLALLPFIVRA